VVAINYPGLQRFLTSTECAPTVSDFVFIKDKTDATGELTYGLVEHSTVDEVHYACIEYLGVRYFALSGNNFKIVPVPDAPLSFTERFVTKTASGSLTRRQILALYGRNRMKLQAADPFEVIIGEVMSPFYLFQYFAIAVWLYTDYIIYSVIVIFITMMSITFVCRDKLFNLRRLHNLAGEEISVKVQKSSGPEVSPSSNLVPGDCFEVTADMAFPCDAILVNGRVVVDESMLTGESVPVTKTQYVSSPTDPDATKRTANILYAGTRVKLLPNNQVVIAMAYKTGFRSARGQCVAALITPKVYLPLHRATLSLLTIRRLR
jgi:magnesium-transporting ATPase (P-type)